MSILIDDTLPAKESTMRAQFMHPYYELLKALVVWGGGGYHPDNAGADYVNLSQEAQDMYDDANTAVCEFFGSNVYDIALKFMTELQSKS